MGKIISRIEILKSYLTEKVVVVCVERRGGGEGAGGGGRGAGGPSIPHPQPYYLHGSETSKMK